jgi:hypothetical protein
MARRTVVSLAVLLVACGGSPARPVAGPNAVAPVHPPEPEHEPPLAEVQPLPRGEVTFRDPAGVSLGSIDLDGDVFDRAHTPIGHLDVDGTVRTAAYELLGTAREDGTLVDPRAEPLLHVDDDGILRSPSFAAIGRIQDDGVVRDVTAKTVSTVDGYRSALRVEVAAFVVFFAHDAIVLQGK